MYTHLHIYTDSTQQGRCANSIMVVGLHPSIPAYPLFRSVCLVFGYVCFPCCKLHFYIIFNSGQRLLLLFWCVWVFPRCLFISTWVTPLYLRVPSCQVSVRTFRGACVCVCVCDMWSCVFAFFGFACVCFFFLFRFVFCISLYFSHPSIPACPFSGGVHTTMYIYIYVCACVYLYVYIYLCTYLCTYICIYIYVCIYMYVYICICIYIHMYIYLYIYKYVYIKICIYIHT